MRSRLDLQTLLESIVGKGHVYFQPPESVKLTFPCIVYNLSGYENQNADDMKYLSNKKYDVLYITKKPDDPVIDQIEGLKGVRFNRWYANDAINHYSYTIIY